MPRSSELVIRYSLFVFLIIIPNSLSPFIVQPYYLVHESLLRHNLQLIADIARNAHVEFILAFKAFALWKTFPIFREYIAHTTASSPYEARLAYEEFGSKAHTYSPAYEDDTFADIVRYSSHITFNSLSQYEHFAPRVKALANGDMPSLGLRINPERSEIETALYDPCAPGSRFGVLSSQLPEHLPAGISGLHCHCHCESSAEALERTLQRIEEKFSPWLSQVEWLNLGGGHLVTRKGYNIKLITEALQSFQSRHPHLHIILEPGSAFAWQTGELIAQVVDVVENKNIKTAILNVSFTCHMPDCLEMPYMPTVRGASIVNEPLPLEVSADKHVFRLGGNSCLSGDYMGAWRFNKELKVGDVVTFEDMIHYTTVKTNMFNGIPHPAIKIEHMDGTVETLREYRYEDYRDRMD